MQDLLSLLRRDTELRRVASTNGGEYAGRCPFCGGHDRFRFWSNPDQGEPRYWCRKCGRRGDVIDYLRDHDHLSYREACEQVGETTIRPVTTDQPASVAQSDKWQSLVSSFAATTQERLWTPVGTEALEYLRSRGLWDDTIVEWQLGYNPRGIKRSEIWFPAGITIPCWEGTRLLGVKVRLTRSIIRPNGTEVRYIAVSGSKKGLWGTRTLDGRDYVAICEGELDALLEWQHVGDILGVLTFTTGADAYRNWPADRLLYLAGRRRILIITDADEAGDKAAAHLISLLGSRARRLRPLIPKDITDLHLAGIDLRAWTLQALFSAEVAASLRLRRACACGANLEGQPWRAGEGFAKGRYWCPVCSANVWPDS